MCGFKAYLNRHGCFGVTNGSSEEPDIHLRLIDRLTARTMTVLPISNLDCSVHVPGTIVTLWSKSRVEISESPLAAAIIN